ncbi:hypothetical protein SAMN05421593_4252 [Chryseobacterium culicis]|jgi:hypothetical protein|uniref:Uncharacterized protein n=1 Tax=Chryseobacterium culicis TaxID=680127 RepID=A0A1H6IEQ7_CHRCI|nr:hypothetical protein SAMN05421593_4252 [Chryseobacterium culicis]
MHEKYFVTFRVYGFIFFKVIYYMIISCFLSRYDMFKLEIT